MPTLTIHGHLVAAPGHVILDGALGVELGAQLVEIGDLEVGAPADGAGLRLQVPEQELEERALAHPVGADDTHFIPAQDQRVEIAHDQPVAPAVGHPFGLRHQASGAIGLGDPQPGRTQGGTPLQPLRPQRLQRAHAAFVAGAPGLDALADPDLLLGELTVEVGVGLGLCMAALLAATQIIAVVPWPVRNLAPVQLQDAVGDPLQETPVVSHEEERARIVFEEILKPVDGVDIEVVCRLVQQEQVRLLNQCLGEQDAPLEPAGEGVVRCIRIQTQTRDDPLGAPLDLPAATLVQLVLDVGQTRQLLRPRLCCQLMGQVEIVPHQPPQVPESLRHQVEDGGVLVTGDLLGQPADARALPHPDLPDVGLDLPGDDP